MTLKPASLQWDDGRLVSLDYGDIYFQPGAGIAESDYVFLQGNRLPERFASFTEKCFRVGELGFGSGLNFLLTAQLFLDRAPASAGLVYMAFEKHPVPAGIMAAVQAHVPEAAGLSRELLAQLPPLYAGTYSLRLAGGRIRLILVLGDIAETLPRAAGAVDAWYLDGFAPDKNPAMWRDDLFPHLFRLTDAGGTLSSFSAAGAVRRGLEAAGFAVSRRDGYGRKRHMTVAARSGVRAEAPRPPVLVAGAGIAGCSVARALAERGYAVTLADARGGLAQGASGNPAAAVYPKLTAAPSAMGDFYAQAFAYATRFYAALAPDAWRACGVVHLDTPDLAARHDKIAAFYPSDLAARGAGQIIYPAGGMLLPPAACRALASHPRIRLQTGRAVEGAAPDGITVVAGGHRAAALLPQLPLQSLRGQVTLLRARAGLETVVCHDGYITPAAGGYHVAGATFQKDCDDEAPRAEDDAENLRKLATALPQAGFAAGDVTGHRAGVRATTRDKMPAAGQVDDSVFAVAGLGARGMTSAPLLGELVAAMIAQEPLPLDARLAAAVSPLRF